MTAFRFHQNWYLERAGRCTIALSPVVVVVCNQYCIYIGTNNVVWIGHSTIASDLSRLNWPSFVLPPYGDSCHVPHSGNDDVCDDKAMVTREHSVI
jgi:hypothetical protein